MIEFSDAIAVHSGEPAIAIGRILALSYDSLVADPLPERMQALLAQLDEAQEQLADNGRS